MLQFVHNEVLQKCTVLARAAVFFRVLLRVAVTVTVMFLLGGVLHVGVAVLLEARRLCLLENEKQAGESARAVRSPRLGNDPVAPLALTGAILVNEVVEVVSIGELVGIDG